MKILFDILHPADVNFFKNAIQILDRKGVEITLTVRTRGPIYDILKKELPNKKILIIGKHHNSLFRKGTSLITRNITLSQYLYKNDFDLCTSFGFFVGTASKLSRTPTILFGDDPEYALTFYLSKFSGNHFVLPSCIQAKGKNIINYKGFKELAYLHPKYFKPNIKILEYYKLKPQNYVFIRNIAKDSLNYKNLKLMDLRKICHNLSELGLKVVLSTEDKNIIDNLDQNCITLKEPVGDIFSLLSFALFTISSGDSMARESCLVGTPSIYIGGRDMKVNQEFIKRHCMFKVSNENELNEKIIEIINTDIKNVTEDTISRALRDEWVDTTSLIVDLLTRVPNKDISFLEKYS